MKVTNLLPSHMYVGTEALLIEIINLSPVILQHWKCYSYTWYSSLYTCSDLHCKMFKLFVRLRNVNFTLWKVTKAQMWSRLRLYFFFSLSARRVWVVHATPRPLYSLVRGPLPIVQRGWMGPKTGMDECGKSRPLPGFEPLSVQLVTNRYTEYASPALRSVTEHRK